MKKNKIFRIIWKIDSVLILISGLMVVVILGYAGYKLYQDVFRSRKVSSFVNVESDTEISAEWRLGGFDRLEGTDYLMAPVYSTQTFQASYYEKGTSAVRNYLFVNAVDKSSRWLIPHNNYLFLNRHQEWHNPAGRSSVVKWLRYEVVKSDTNQDGRLTSEDQRTIGISDPTGESYVELISDVDRILGYEMRDENNLLIFYRTGTKNFIAEINLPERRITVTEELPEIQP
ncbi:MAG: hypothetical protein KAU23_02840 [Anaerolineales bacterium]|nr:hypothetical protein [Anaerolineales bacterium]